MVTMKNVPARAQLRSASEKAARAVGRVNWPDSARTLHKLARQHPVLREVFKHRTQIARLQTQRGQFCSCGECTEYWAEEIAVFDARIALAFREMRKALKELQADIDGAKMMIDEAVSSLEIHDLLAICPDQ